MSQLTNQEQLAWARYLATYRRPKGNLTMALRRQLAEQQNWRCCYCGVRMEGTGGALDAPTFEHVIPRSKGGTDQLANVVIACWRCNNVRGDGDKP